MPIAECMQQGFNKYWSMLCRGVNQRLYLLFNDYKPVKLAGIWIHELWWLSWNTVWKGEFS